jgi:hypothetical protein
MKWRKWNNIIHRDLGYLMVGLTIIYAISGILLNHKHDWNPSYSIKKETLSFQPLPKGAEITPDTIKGLLTQVNQPTEYNGTFRPDPQHVQVFYQGKTVTFNIETGNGEIEEIHSRKILKGMNQLHLNNTSGNLWTWIADFYAFALLLLGITGLFVLKGKNGLSGRGKWLTAAGIIIPIIFLIIYTL